MWQLPMSTWTSKGDEIVTLPGTSHVVTYYRAAAFLSNFSPNATQAAVRAICRWGLEGARKWTRATVLTTSASCHKPTSGGLPLEQKFLLRAVLD